MLVVYAALMSISGAIFLATEDYLALIAAALVGTINVTGSETGAFLSIEQALLPQTVSNVRKRNAIFALYNMAATFAMSVGILLSVYPAIVQHQFGLSQIESIKPLFMLYSILCIIVIILYSML